MSGNGWCTHPDRQVSSDVRILVRKAELACRNAWGSDLWEDVNATETPAAKTPRSPQVDLPAPPIAASFDDTVTSVFASGDQRAPKGPVFEDEVVEQSTISFVDDYGYDEEEDERRNLLYRDSRSAIERARQKHAGRLRTAHAASDEDHLIAEGVDAEEEPATSVQQPVFEPDDFIEEEAPSSTSATSEDDDALLSEGIRTPTLRSRRLRQSRDERPLPKEQATTKSEPDLDAVELELPPSAAPERGRFDSIPEVSADVDLPLLRRSSSAPEPEEARAPVSEPESVSYERALKRAHAVNAAARTESEQERRRTSAPVAVRRQPAPAEMPDLPDASPIEAAPVNPIAPVQVPAGTSAVLHPRRHAERADQPERRPVMQSRTEGAEPLPAERSRSRRQSPEARQSWWRGSRKDSDTHTYDDTQADEWDVDQALTAVAPAEPAAMAVSPRRNFDLHDEDELHTFRDHLFANAPESDEAEPTEVAARAPIAVARRRPIAPPPRTRQQPTAPAQPEPEVQQPQAEVQQFQRDVRLSEPETAQPQREVRQPQREVRLPEPEVHALAQQARPVRQDVDVRPTVRQRPEPPRHDAAPREPQRHVRRPDAPLYAEARVAPQMPVQGPEDQWHEPEPALAFDIRTVIEDDTELLDMTITIAPGVPKACATCRSYRPSEQPGRGWCTNEWAFTHRQMVNETNIACDSTIGCWWLPADEETWLGEFTLPEKSTPRIDRLLARLGRATQESDDQESAYERLKSRGRAV